ncbi:MAG: ribosome biogenesis GTPase Der [Hyphomicrobiales bacterium]|nr:ribosome biogenesis GTPase Der [Hyphomicrobiales bacterium]
MFTVALIGRPNVGKSTLFNRLTGRKSALVSNTPGVTRDRREGTAELGDITFTLIDTAGLEEAEADSLQSRMMAQTERAAKQADILLLVLDGKDGVTPTDTHFANWVRRFNKPVILLVNKSDRSDAKSGSVEAYQLGLGTPIPISAEHGLGLYDLAEALAAYTPEIPGEPVILDDNDDEGTEHAPGLLRIALIGRPNAGKSTLFNQMIGEERSITGPEAGITRDAIETRWAYQGNPVMLVDTAGIRKKAKITGELEKLSVQDSLHSVRFAQVVLLLVDATQGLDRQDLALAGHTLEEGRILVVVANKWDAVTDPADVRKSIAYRLEQALPQGNSIPIVTVSALKGKGVDTMMEQVLMLYARWDSRISTGKLNTWLEQAITRHPPPLVGNRRIRLRYITQIKTRPPTFALFTTSKASALPESYMRYLTNSLTETYNMQGVPIRILLRKQNNPYQDTPR